MARKNAKKLSKKHIAPDLEEEDDDDSDVIPVIEPEGNWLTRNLFKPKLLLLLALGVSSIVGASQLRRHLPDLAQRQEYRISPGEVRITPPPQWVPANFVNQVFTRAELPEQVSLLNDELVTKIGEAFRKHPWIEEVISVHKEASVGIEAELKYRIPVAMIRVPNGLYPVDRNGVLLPPEDFSAEESRRYPLVENIQSMPQGAAGTNWGDPIVPQAAQLAEALAHSWEQMEFSAIYAPVTPSGEISSADPIFALRTSGGSRIIWGRAPGSGHPGELSAEQKIGRLQKYRADFGRFDQPHGPYEIDIRHWQEISRRPLSANRSRERR